jgi:hypothetical protein
MFVERPLWTLATGLAWVAVAACSSSPSSDPPADDGIVVGIQSDGSLAGALGSLHVVATVASSPAADVVLTPTALPDEIPLAPPSADSTAAVAVRIEGYESPGWTARSSEAPLLVRTAETHFVAGQRALLRIVLQGQCLLALPGGPPGGPTCTAPQTCIGGACQGDAVPPQSLEPDAANWAENAPDVCKPLHAGPPVVQVGVGQTDYLPVTSGQTVQMEQGPQGGHHIWVAVRQQNLKQSGSTTTITSVVPTIGLAGPKTSFVFNFDPDEGDFCKLYGLRYQLDVDGTDYHEFLGRPLDVTVTIKDPGGATGTGTAHLNIDPQLLCPSDIPGCS